MNHIQDDEFSGVPDATYQSVSPTVFTNIVLQAIQQFDVDHKILTTSFLFQNETPYEWSGDALIAHFQNGQNLNVSFEIAGEFWRI